MTSTPRTLSESLSSRTRLYAILGDPVGHSLSPAFQNAAFDDASLDAVYLALRTSTELLPGLLRGIALSGGGGNVTVPHKEVAAASVDVATDAVTLTGACNTFWCEDDRVHGDNTDIHGFVRAAEELLGGRSLTGSRVLLIGAGGAARGAAYGLAREGADEIVISNRSVDRAVEIRDRFASLTGAIRVAGPGELVGETFDLVVNATSLGLSADDPFPLMIEDGPSFDAALDMVYAPDRTPWIAALRERGVVAEDGLEMLLHQGAAAFERWWGFPPSMVTMRDALPQR